MRRDGWLFVLIWTVVGGLGALFLGYLMTWWLRAEIDSLGQQKLLLAAEIAQMQETAKQWEKKAGKADLSNCQAMDGRRRLYVRVDEEAGRFSGRGEEKTNRVIWRY